MSFDRFRTMALTDPELLDELVRSDPEALIDLVVERASAAGLLVTAADVEAAITTERRAWFERWV